MPRPKVTADQFSKESHVGSYSTTFNAMPGSIPSPFPMTTPTMAPSPQLLGEDMPGVQTHSEDSNANSRHSLIVHPHHPSAGFDDKKPTKHRGHQEGDINSPEHKALTVSDIKSEQNMMRNRIPIPNLGRLFLQGEMTKIKARSTN